MDCGNQDLVDIDLALGAVLALARPVAGNVMLPIGAALGRVTAADIHTGTALPPFDHSAVDGYGITAEDLSAVRDGLRIVADIAAGHDSGRSLAPGETVRLFTGAPIPAGVAAVLFEERCRRAGSRLAPGGRMTPGANIRRRGEDVAAGELIVDRGTVIDARHIALLAAAGVMVVRVVRPLRVAVLSNGDELREPSVSLEPGTIHDSNRPMLLALLAGPSVEPCDAGLHPDDPGRLADAVARAAAFADVVFLSGGASGSDADHAATAIEACGGRALRLKLQLKPGKPVVVGCVDDRPVLGLPGNPVAAMVNFLLFGRPLLRAMLGAPADRPRGQSAIAAEPIRHAKGRREFLPARIVGRTADDRVMLAKLGRGGSARLRPLALADGLAELPAGRGDCAAGDPVAFHPFASGLTR